MKTKQLEFENLPVRIPRSQLKFARERLNDRLEHTEATLAVTGELVAVYLRLQEVETPLFKASLFHDCARELPANEQLELARKFRGTLDDIERESSALWHAPAGGQLLVEELGFSPEDKIVRAVGNHSTGTAGMSPVLKGLLVADFTERTRPFPAAHRLRNKFDRLNFNDLVRNVLEEKISACMKNNKKLHPRSIEAYNSLCD